MTSDKAYAVEARLTRLVAEGWAVPLLAWKSSQEDRANTTTLAPDADLTLDVAAGARYELAGLLGYIGPSGAGFKWTFGSPSGATVRYSAAYRDTTGALQGSDWLHGATTYAGQSTGVGNEFKAEIGRGYVTIAGTAGQLYLQWAQNVSNATATSLLYGSYLALRRIN